MSCDTGKLFLSLKIDFFFPIYTCETVVSLFSPKQCVGYSLSLS